MKETDIPAINCPYCNYKMDAATGVCGAEDATPHPGDLSICLNCARVSVFTESLGMRMPTKEEALEYSLDPRVIAVQMARTALPEDLRR